MQKVKEIFEQIQSTSAKTGKEQILRENADNELLQKTLHFLLNPYITTGLSKKKINKQVPPTRSHFQDAVRMMNYLQENNTGTDAIIGDVQGFIRSQPEDMREFYKELFTKSLKLGCAASTVNKVFGKDFIPTFDVMLAEKFSDNVSKVEGKEFSVTMKLDGIRCIAIKDGNSVNLFSRQGQPIEGLTEIESELLKHSSNLFVLDGELLISDTDGIPSKDQYKATTKIVRKDGKKTGITFRAFDLLMLEEFRNQKCNTSYKQRREVLELLFDDTEYIKVLPVLYSGTDISKIYEILNEVRANGEEGIMLNINDAPYEFKRTKNLLKVKIMNDCDLEIIGFEDGQGRLAGTLGRLNVDYKGNILGVGSGFSDEQRKWFWENQNDLIGRVVTIKYFEETQNQNGGISLRFPVFSEFREEGKEISYD